MSEALRFEHRSQVLTFESHVKVSELLARLETLYGRFDPPLAGLRVNGLPCSWNEVLSTGGTVELLDLNSSLGHKIYRRSLCFVFDLALKASNLSWEPVLGPSLGNGYLFLPPPGTIPTEAELLRVEREMKTLVDADLPLTKELLSFKEARESFSSQGLSGALLSLDQKNEARVLCSRCHSAFRPFRGELLPHTGLLSLWSLEAHAEGWLLRLPEKTWPLRFTDLEDKPLLLQAFRESKHWARILGVPDVPHLNELVRQSQAGTFIQVNETRQERALGLLADRIASTNPPLRFVLTAGPSSSGKTTFTKKLAVHLQSLGLQPKLLSLDDYFVPREDTPKDAQGHYDFESLEALRLEKLNADLLALQAGQLVETPIFDFKTGRPKDQTRPLQLAENQILLMEGIHGLNPRLTYKIPRSSKFFIYVSALSQLNLDNYTRLSTTDHRLLRRMVRDHQFRGYSAEKTLSMWGSVRRGEDTNIFPYQAEADALFNTALDYELNVLRPYAEPLLRTISPDSIHYDLARRLLDLLAEFLPVRAHQVPVYSILREFIGESGFHY